MPLFLIERDFAEQLELTEETLAGVVDYNNANSLRWLFSFLSADKKKTYCLYEAPDAEALLKQARDLGLPADAVVEVKELNPEMFAAGTTVTGHLAT